MVSDESFCYLSGSFPIPHILKEQRNHVLAIAHVVIGRDFHCVAVSFLELGQRTVDNAPAQEAEDAVYVGLVLEEEPAGQTVNLRSE